MWIHKGYVKVDKTGTKYRHYIIMNASNNIPDLSFLFLLPNGFWQIIGFFSIEW